MKTTRKPRRFMKWAVPQMLRRILGWQILSTVIIGALMLATWVTFFILIFKTL